MVTQPGRSEKVGILLIGHKVNEMLAVSDRITALIDGRIALSGAANEVTRADLIAAITGKETVHEVPKAAGPVERKRRPQKRTRTRHFRSANYPFAACRSIEDLEGC